jgi:hypothetical protein
MVAVTLADIFSFFGKFWLDMDDDDDGDEV